ncbi:MFS transporter [Acidocella aminolytica]|uniref:Major facilitator superfamily transporter n=1 Tax=Acidocella aminolytica 101 = DSM 11237 TaxID=1120923 RepID=A0A0D6PC78_9PROT|nr:MFS transporter [Acidocella aminolytica]GAN79262.1 major facilitator superfamily transporter [Acidocella aminolytica 101 = DSM 11237]GBQ39702.1 major facilitator superfamily transporter [Acidocella aminolytica 101 = DSM 11237]SHE37052.1 Cyanate permease [Acidocella aminolytica 101 = DSM 11237]
MLIRLSIVIASAFFGSGAFWMFLPLLSVSLRGEGVGDFWVGVISGLPWVGLLAMSSFIPAIIRRVGLKRMILIGMSACTLVFMCFAMTRDVRLWSLLCLVMGAALSLRWAGMDTWMNGSFPAHLRGRLTGLYELILSGSMAVGPGILALSGSSGSTPFLAGAAVTACAAITLGIAGKEAPHATAPGTNPARQRDILLHEKAAFIGIFVVGLTEACNLSLLPLFGLSRGLSVHLSALLVVVVQSGVAAGALVIGSLADHMDVTRLRNISACAMIVLPLGLVFGLKTEPWPWLIVWGLAQGGVFTLGIVRLASRHTGLGLASAMSLSMVIYTLGGIAGPPALGLCMSLLGPRGFAFGLAGAALASTFAILLIRSTPRPAGTG